MSNPEKGFVLDFVEAGTSRRAESLQANLPPAGAVAALASFDLWMEETLQAACARAGVAWEWYQNKGTGFHLALREGAQAHHFAVELTRLAKRASRPSKMAFRIGIAAGQVSFDSPPLFTADNCSVEAARLQAECPPGGILISPDARDLLPAELKDEYDSIQHQFEDKHQQPFAGHRWRDGADFPDLPKASTPKKAEANQEAQPPLPASSPRSVVLNVEGEGKGVYIENAQTANMPGGTEAGRATSILPPLTTVIDGPDAAHEFTRLIGRLLALQGQKLGCKGLISPFQIPPQILGSTVYEEVHPFCGLEPIVALTSSWQENDAAESDRFAAVFGHQPGGNCTVKNWVFITPIERAGIRWESLVAAFKEQGIAAHNFHQPHLEKWLRECPALLARYYPEHAAQRPDAHGFDAREARAWASAVTERVFELHRRIQLFGFPTSHRKAANETGHVDPNTFLLEDVFVPQMLIPSGMGGDAAVTLGDLRKGLERPRVLRGDPGSGKTSILRFLAADCARTTSRAGTTHRRQLPFFLSLRNFALYRKEQPTLLEAIARQLREDASLSPAETHRWHLEGLLEIGDAVVFCDGLDEAGDVNLRQEIAGFIEQFHQQYPLCPIWVTSRIVGYESAPLDSKLFAHYDVAPFTSEQQTVFVGKWYDLQMPGPEQEAARKTKAATLLKYLHKDAPPDIQEMAGNPLLLTLMAWVHYDRGHVPSTRGQLFDACVEIFIHKRDKQRFSGAPSELDVLEPPIRNETSRYYYSAIAYDVQKLNQDKGREGRGIIPIGDLQLWLLDLRKADLKSSIGHRADLDVLARQQVEVFLRFSDERCGLLRDRGAGTYAFLHLSFQDYLAAERIATVHAGKFDKFRQFIFERVSLDAWRECLLLLLFKLRDIRVPTGEGSDDEISLVGRSDIRFIDWLVKQSGGDTQVGIWRLLGMALRDQLEMAADHQQLVLRKLIEQWLGDPSFLSEPFKILEQVVTYAPLMQALLVILLEEVWLRRTQAGSLQSLHLRIRLLGWPSEPSRATRLADELHDHLQSQSAPEPFQLAAEILAVAGGNDVLGRQVASARCVRLVRDRLEQLMVDPQRPVQDRSRSGMALGRLGDLRVGVGVVPATGLPHGLPDLAWNTKAWTDEIPAGQFQLGCTQKEARYPDEQPQIPFSILNPFRLSRHLITVAQYECFVKDDGYDPDRPHWTDAAREWLKKEKITGPESYGEAFQTRNHPQVGVSCYEAQAFAVWLHTHRLPLGVPENWTIRLPTEAEWERAARSGDGRVFPWCAPEKCPSETVLTTHCNWSGTGLGTTSAVGLFPIGKAACGALDMTGNVWEWSVTQWQKNYEGYQRSVDESPEGNETRVLRGGSWRLSDPDLLRAAFRRYSFPGHRFSHYGFRLVCVGESS